MPTTTTTLPITTTTTCPPLWLGYENFLCYFEDDAGGYIGVSHNTLDVNAVPRNVTAMVWDDKGVGHFRWWQHDFEVLPIAHDVSVAAGGCAVWAVSNTVDDTWHWLDNGDEALLVHLYWNRPSSPAPGWRLHLVDAATSASDASVELTQGHRYYCRVLRAGADVWLYIYSDAARTVLVDVLHITTDADTAYEYIFACNAQDAGIPDTITFDVANLDLNEGMTTTPGGPPITTTTVMEIGPTTTLPPSGEFHDAGVYIDGAERTDVTVRRLTRSYTAPWTAELAYTGRHDDTGGEVLRLGQAVSITDADTAEVIFAGWITEVAPGGVGSEGITYTAANARFRIENEPVNVNGSGFYVWNRRGFQCDFVSGEDSPGRDGGLWTVGEIVVDILEHALGIPPGGSAIPGHHSRATCVTNTYLTSADISGYDASEWLALDSIIGEFGVDNTPVAQALDDLLAWAGGFYGWYIDPAGILHLVNLAGRPVGVIEAGELGEWQDAAGKNYTLMGNELKWSLDGVYSRVVIQGTGKTVEVKPANLDGCGNAAINGGGELELIDSPWKGYFCAYRHIEQPYRVWSWKGVGWNGSCRYGGCECGVPAGLIGIYNGPRIYKGTAAGAKSFVAGPGGYNWRVNLAIGIVMFYWNAEAALEGEEKLWGWYWAQVPFTVSAGPEGTGYTCFGQERTYKIYDPAFKHPDSFPQVGDDEAAMLDLAGRMLEQRKDVRVQGTLSIDELDPTTNHLLYRWSVSRLTAPVTSTTSGCWPSPLDWGNLRVNCVEVTYDFERRATELTVANTFFMLPEYSALKERLEMRLAGSCEYGQSEDIIECQVQPGDFCQKEWEEEHGTTTGYPPTTTTVLPPTTTTLAPTTTTTTLPCDLWDDFNRADNASLNA